MLASEIHQQVRREEGNVPTMHRNSCVWLDDKQSVATSDTAFCFCVIGWMRGVVVTTVPDQSSFSWLAMTAPNPYATPSSPPASSAIDTGTRCPVCNGALSRLRLVLPFSRCPTCHRRIRLRNSTRASFLSTLAAIGCFISLLQFEVTPDTNGWVFGIHALVFISLGTFWFHLYGEPALTGWIGNASREKLAQERDKFRTGLP
ncbi:hypothetical protein Mal65_02780 [Crateriforma conspicua]|nr:hypothetical protein Mal65_02780 [Crateriforma conspicua]